jgi:uncharacterized membrane protein
MLPDTKGGSTIPPGLGKGCLAGLALAVGFLVISGLVYLVLSLASLPRNILLLVSIASGPILGNVIVLIVFLLRSKKVQRQYQKDHETTSRNTP